MTQRLTLFVRDRQVVQMWCSENLNDCDLDEEANSTQCCLNRWKLCSNWVPVWKQLQHITMLDFSVLLMLKYSWWSSWATKYNSWSYFFLFSEVFDGKLRILSTKDARPSQFWSKCEQQRRERLNDDSITGLTAPHPATVQQISFWSWSSDFLGILEVHQYRGIAITPV